ncbi:MAG: radical SAM protein [Candidatus Aenigmatarchaeota archaeon]
MGNNNDISYKIFPPYVNWEMTNRCNMGCPYCFLGDNPEGALPDLGTGIMKDGIRKLAENGARMLNYAGGEPLLRKDMVELIEYGHGLGLKTILSTNGVLLSEELINELDGKLGWISLPVDGYDSRTHDSVRRRKGHFEEIVEKLELIGKTRINLKINSMLCKKNISYVKEIAGLLDEFNVKKWKLFQFSARGKARKIKEEYEISDKEFLCSKERIGLHDFDIIYSTNELRDNAYFLIGADGKVTVPSGEKYIPIGNLLEDLTAFKDLDVLKIQKNIANARVSYGFRW